MSEHEMRLSSSPKYRVAFLTNVIPPYRRSILLYLSKVYRLRIVVSSLEDNRGWDHSLMQEGLDVQTVYGKVWRRFHRTSNRRVKDIKYFHIDPGLLAALMQFRPHAIISSEMGFRSLVALLYGQIFRCPVWIWWGGTPHTERSTSRFRMNLRRNLFARVTDRWISYGNQATSYLLSIGVHQGRILQVQNAVDDIFLDSRRDRRHQPLANIPSILFVGQLVDRKGLPQLLSVLHSLQNAGCHFHLTVVGNGPELTRYQTQATELGIYRVSWITHVEPSLMPQVYNAADLLVFPTLEDVWGLVINEALLSGIPVLASCYAGAASELLPASQVFDPLNFEEFYHVVSAALNDGLPQVSTEAIVPVLEVARAIADDIYENLEGS